MPRYDVWLYSVFIEAENETEACKTVTQMIADAGLSSKIRVDCAEEFEGE